MRGARPITGSSPCSGPRKQAVGQVVATGGHRDGTGAVQIGKLKVSVTGGNLAAWTGGEVPDSLEVTSQKGSHSAALKRLADDRTKIDSLTVTVAAPNRAASSWTWDRSSSRSPTVASGPTI